MEDERSGRYEILNYVPMMIFSFIGQLGPSVMGSSWVTAFFCATPLSIMIMFFFRMSGERGGCFLVTSILYLVFGFVLILMNYKPGYDLLLNLMASGFFGLYFLVHFLQLVFSRFCNKYIKEYPKYPEITLGLYLGVAVVTYFLRDQALWLSAVIFLIVRFFVAYIERVKS